MNLHILSQLAAAFRRILSALFLSNTIERTIPGIDLNFSLLKAFRIYSSYGTNKWFSRMLVYSASRPKGFKNNILSKPFFC
jgi:hypothetical protein